MYRAKDSSDNYLMEYISPSHQLQRKLAEGRSGLATQQLQAYPVFMTPPKSMMSKHRAPNLRKFNKQGADSREFDSSSRNPFTAFSETGSARPKSAAVQRTFERDQHREVIVARSPVRRHSRTKFGDLPLTSFGEKLQPSALQTHHNSKDCKDARKDKFEISTSDRDKAQSSEDLLERDSEGKVQLEKLTVDENQKASDLRFISKLWHQECKCSVTIQQRLSYLLNSKYREAFEDGRMYTVEECKHNDFKVEVARILKNLDRAGAPQLPTLHVKYEFAVACVDEMFGKGMGEEYMKLEHYFMQPSVVKPQQSSTMVTDADSVREIVERVQHEYKDVQTITGFMLDQLSLFELREDLDSF